MLKLDNKIRLNNNEAQFVKDVTGLNNLPTTVDQYDAALEISAQNLDDGTPEGRLLAGLARLSKSTPDELDVVEDEG